MKKLILVFAFLCAPTLKAVPDREIVSGDWRFHLRSPRAVVLGLATVYSHAEDKLAALILTRSNSAPLQGLAQRMQQDSKALTTTVDQFARERNLFLRRTVQESDLAVINEKLRSQYRDLKDLRGAEFDAEVIKVARDMQQDKLKAYEHLGGALSDPEVLAFLNEHLYQQGVRNLEQIAELSEPKDNPVSH